MELPLQHFGLYKDLGVIAMIQRFPSVSQIDLVPRQSLKMQQQR